MEAFEKLALDPCEGLELGKFDRRHLAKMLDAAIASGDPRASAWKLSSEIESEYHAALGRGENRAGYRVSSEAFDQIRNQLASGDPEAIREVQGVLSSTLEGAVIRFLGEPIDPYTMNAALSLVSCDLGGACGQDSRDLLTHCAMAARCSASNLYEYIYYYDNSPSQAQQIEQYRQALLSMFNSRDFSGLTFNRGTAAPGSIVFGGRRGM